MFGAKKESKTRSNIIPSSTNHALNSLVKGTTVKGDIISENDFRIDGELVGTLNCKAKVIIGPTGKVNGDIRCQNAMIEGSFTGTLKVLGLLNIRETAKVDGNITTQKVIVQSGAVFNVNCHMGANMPNIVNENRKAVPQ